LRAADQILSYYDTLLSRHGDSAPGAGWPNQVGRETRFAVMLDLIPDGAERPSVCDLGCGTGELLTHLQGAGRDLRYTGIDRSAAALAIAREKHPDTTFLDLDLLADDLDLAGLEFDYVIANGLFTVRADARETEMREFWTSMVERMWVVARRGIAFNLMSTVVDWTRPDLFHVSYDETAALLHRLAGRNVVLRADYGLHEYTAYAYRGDSGRKPVTRARVSAPEVSAGTPQEGGRARIVEPRLPPAGKLVGYLQTVDAGRWYSNFGPLSLEFGSRLAERLAVPPRCAVPASSGTAALIAGIVAAAGTARPERPIALVPTYTFAATALAAEACGYDVRLADVDERTWALDVDSVRAREDLDQIGLVVPVAALGRALPAAAWREFYEQTSIPVVLDAAAAIEHHLDASGGELGAVPTVFSLHATKTLSTGEGGLLVSADEALALAAARALHFGLATDRSCVGFAINGKMSEYHAAVGLAELDGWQEKRQRLAQLAMAYRTAFASRGIERPLRLPPELASCYAVLCCHDGAEADRLGEALAQLRIQTRNWYRPVLGSQPHFARAGERTPVAERLASQLLGLPAGPALAVGVVELIAETVRRTLHSG
jgi:dTDP-4-amino-4,6-dideoxygalactose transaminase/SAM-dependent methyltransferase